MHLRRYSTLLWVSAIVLLFALLLILAGLQFRWIDQITNAERERRQAHLQAAASRLVQEFDRELMRACAAFFMTPFEWREGEWRHAAERYKTWSETAPYPKLIGDLYVYAREGAPALYRLDTQTGDARTVPWPAALAPLRRRLEMPRPADPAGSRPMAPRVHWTVDEEIPALVLWVSQPGFGRGRGAAFSSEDSRPLQGALVLTLNLEFIRDEFLPQLSRKHLGSVGHSDYVLALVSKADRSQWVYLSPSTARSYFLKPDITVSLLGLRVEDARDLLPPGIAGGNVSAASLPSSSRIRPPGWPRPRGRPLAFESVSSGEEGRWLLLVTHRSGSLEFAVAGLRFRHLAISATIVLLLAASAGMIVVLTLRAQRLARLQSEFLAGISHELLTPLSVIRSASENLADGVVNSEVKARHYGEMIRGQSRRLSEMVQDALGFAVAQSRRAPRFRSVDVEDVIRRAVETCRPALSEAQVEFIEEIEPGLPPMRGDATALSHALRNLLMNGLQYGGEGKWLALRARRASGRHGPEVEIVVEDRGPGIARADLPRIFDPFYRGRTADASRLHGTGLGLSLVKRIVEDHGGQVSVTAAQPKGALFSLRLPAASGEPEE